MHHPARVRPAERVVRAPCDGEGLGRARAKGGGQDAAKAQEYVAEHGILAVSIVTRYEILRGLRARSATRKMAVFTQFRQRSSIVPLTEAAVSIAADIYANLYARGLLIAATAMSHGLIVVTNNESHFGRIEGLTVENWLR